MGESPKSPAKASGSTGTPTAYGNTFPRSSAYGPITNWMKESKGLL